MKLTKKSIRSVKGNQEDKNNKTKSYVWEWIKDDGSIVKTVVGPGRALGQCRVIEGTLLQASIGLDPTLRTQFLVTPHHNSLPPFLMGQNNPCMTMQLKWEGESATG